MFEDDFTKVDFFFSFFQVSKMWLCLLEFSLSTVRILFDFGISVSSRLCSLFFFFFKREK